MKFISQFRRGKWLHADNLVLLVAFVSGLGFLGGLLMVFVGLARDQRVPTWAWIAIVLGAAAFLWSAWYTAGAKRRVLKHQEDRDEKARKIREAVLRGDNPPSPYFVYLRPFSIDSVDISDRPKDASRAYVEEYGLPEERNDLESTLALLVDPFGEFVALSGESSGVGPGYARSTGASFKEEVRALCTHAEGILVVPFVPEGRESEAHEPGIVQEIEVIVEHGWLNKTFFVMPPMQPRGLSWLLQTLPFIGSWRGKPRDSSENFRDRWEAGRARFPELDLPEYDPGGCLVQVAAGGYVFKVFGHYGGHWRHRTREDGGLEALGSRLDELTSGDSPRKTVV